jgi:hypothetical protein
MPPVVSTIDQITLYAQELLELCDQALLATTDGAPDVSYLAHSIPAIDCEQLTVEVLSLGDHPLPATTTLSPGRRLTAAINVVGFRVTIARCVPVLDEQGNPPPPDEIQAAAERLHQDLFAIWTRVRTAQKAGELFGGLCDHLFYDGAFPLEESGGYAGYTIDFRVSIDGFANLGT